MLMKFRDKYPQIDKAAFVADNATIIGDVTLEEDATVWFGAVLRGDSSSIKVGQGSNIQDNCTLHCDEGSPLSVGPNVTVGHNVILHGCTVEDNCLIGMGAVIMNDAVIGEGAELEYVILDKNVTVRPGARLIGTAKNPIIVKRGETV